MLFDLLIQLCLSRAAKHRSDADLCLAQRDLAREEGRHCVEELHQRDHDMATGRARKWASRADRLAWRVA